MNERRNGMKVLAVLAVLALAFTGLTMTLEQGSDATTDVTVYVDGTADSEGTGTQDSPYKTIYNALDKNKDVEGNLTIYLLSDISKDVEKNPLNIKRQVTIQSSEEGTKRTLDLVSGAQGNTSNGYIGIGVADQSSAQGAEFSVVLKDLSIAASGKYVLAVNSKVNLTIYNCNLDGWCGVYALGPEAISGGNNSRGDYGAKDSTITIQNSSITATNKASSSRSGQDDFGAIAIHAEDVKMDLVNTKVTLDLADTADNASSLFYTGSTDSANEKGKGATISMDSQSTLTVSHAGTNAEVYLYFYGGPCYQSTDKIENDTNTVNIAASVTADLMLSPGSKVSFINGAKLNGNIYKYDNNLRSNPLAFSASTDFTIAGYSTDSSGLYVSPSKACLISNNVTTYYKTYDDAAAVAVKYSEDTIKLLAGYVQNTNNLAIYNMVDLNGFDWQNNCNDKDHRFTYVYGGGFKNGTYSQGPNHTWWNVIQTQPHGSDQPVYTFENVQFNCSAVGSLGGTGTIKGCTFNTNDKANDCVYINANTGTISFESCTFNPSKGATISEGYIRVQWIADGVSFGNVTVKDCGNVILSMNTPDMSNINKISATGNTVFTDMYIAGKDASTALKLETSAALIAKNTILKSFADSAKPELEIASGGTLTIGEGKTLTIVSDGTLKNGGTITNNGQLTIVGGGQFWVLKDGTLKNNGTVRNDGTIEGGTQFRSYGKVTSDNTGTICGNTSNLALAGAFSGIFEKQTVESPEKDKFGLMYVYKQNISVDSERSGSLTIQNNTIKMADNDVSKGRGLRIQTGVKAQGEPESFTITVSSNTFVSAKEKIKNAVLLEIGNNFKETVNFSNNTVTGATGGIDSDDGIFKLGCATGTTAAVLATEAGAGVNVAIGTGFDQLVVRAKDITLLGELNVKEVVIGSTATSEEAKTLTVDQDAALITDNVKINKGGITNNGLVIILGEVSGWTPAGKVLTLETEPSSVGSVAIDSVSGSDVKATAVAESGYVFKNWTDGTITDAKATKSFSVSGVMTWTAVFETATNVTVTFDSQGGSSVPAQTIVSGTAAKEPSEPTRDGYSFAGWYTDTEYGTKFDFTTKLTQDITLYAKWTTVPATYFTVTFMKDASTPYTTAKVESGKMASAPATDPTVAGSRFLGWYTTAGVTTVTAEKFDFSTKITEDITLYAGWIATCTIALPDSVENCTLSQTGKKVVSVSEGSFSFDVTPAAGYTAVVTLTQNGEDSDPIEIATTGTVTIYDLTSNVAVYVMIKAADGTYTETSKTVTENTDGTTTVIDTVVETSTSGDVEITETTSTDDEESTATTATATITDTTATLTVETSSTDVAKVTETIVYAITEAAEAAGTTAVDIDVTVSTKVIELPKVILNNDGVKSLTVTVNSGSANSARISIPTDVLYSDDMADTISISVTSSTSKPASSALKGSSAIAAFDLGLTGTNTTEFNSDVSISYDVKLPTGAKNVRAYCIDSNEFVKASYRNGTANFSVPHFSAWTIVYDEPVIIIEDDDDILFILEQQKKAQEAASSQTTTEDNSGEEAAIIIAAAAVAGAMLACAFFAFRRN